MAELNRLRELAALLKPAPARVAEHQAGEALIETISSALKDRNIPDQQELARLIREFTQSIIQLETRT